MSLRVELVTPEGRVWAGRARMVIARTADGEIGVLTGHAPVLGILAEGSLLRVLDPEEGQPDVGGPVIAAVSSGFLSVADDKVAVLAREALLRSQVDPAAAQATLDAHQAAAGERPPTEVKYAEAQLRAAGERS